MAVMEGFKSRMKEKIAQMLLPSDSEDLEDSDDDSDAVQFSQEQRLRSYSECASPHRFQNPNLLQVPGQSRFRHISNQTTPIERKSSLLEQSKNEERSLFGSLFRRKSAQSNESGRPINDDQQAPSRYLLDKRSNSIAMTK